MSLAFVQYRLILRKSGKKSEHIFLSPVDAFPDVDKWYWQQGELLVLDQRPSISDFMMEDGFPFTTIQQREELFVQSSLAQQIAALLSDEQVGLFQRKLRAILVWIDEQKEASLLLSEELLRDWVVKLQGRRLLLTEVEKSFGQLHRKQLMRLLQVLYLQGFFSWNSAVGLAYDGARLEPIHNVSQKLGLHFFYSLSQKLGLNDMYHKKRVSYYCRRCGYGEKPSVTRRLQEAAIVEVACASCGRSQCGYCPHCLRLGRAKSCFPLLDWSAGFSELEIGQQEGPLITSQWLGELSPLQDKAANKIKQFVQSGAKREFLLFAVCGAGKTEMLFPTIEYALQQEKRILITSPRRDVVIELAPRLKQAFPTMQIRVLHADSDEKYEYADVYLATTHQTLRFYHYFDIVILDEEDAFPYHYDPMLSYAVNRARKPQGQFIYLSATPNKLMLQKALSGAIDSYQIRGRFHGYPLAIPQVSPIGNWRKKMAQGEIVTPFFHFISTLQEERYAYLFVPYVRDLVIVQEYLQQYILPLLQQKDMVVETVHAKDKERTEKVERFRKHQIRILITTTILERGVTIPYCDVGVLGSDTAVFDTAALIQMAGRTGRKLDDPIGHVSFFPEVKTNAQGEAIRQIKSWNALRLEEQE